MDKFKIFLEKAKKIHKNKYNYSLVNYVNAKTKIEIICPIHGNFWQLPRVHLRGSGCPKCSYRLNNGDDFLKIIKLKHGSKYDYSLVDYTGIKNKIKIICPIHGVFEQTAENHLKGHNCPKCNKTQKLTLKEFISKAKLVHGDKYDYSLVDYKNNETKIKIICPIHGIFEQQPNNHLQGKGCKLCAIKKISSDTLNFIKKAKNIHGDKYDYSKVNYVDSKTKIKIICPIHGIFETTPETHLKKCECPKCNIAYQTKSNQKFINSISKIHGNKYDYSLVNYKNCRTKVKIICPIHGVFSVRPGHLLNGQGCPKCGNSISDIEIELSKFIESLNIKIEKNNRKIIAPFELDIFIPSHNLAIEFDGLYWHSEVYKDKMYHLNKTLKCEAKNIKLIHIFEDEWALKKDIVKSRLKNILGLTTNKIYARKCEIKEISIIESKIFLENNHLQGYTNSLVKLGLFYNKELVSVMLFNKPRKGIGGSFDGYELSRFANKTDYNVIGGASKLLKYFISTYNPKEIRSYADRRWSDGGLYETLGFELTHINRPNYWYIINNERKHRFNFRKEKLQKEGFDITNKTEHEIMLARKIYRIYDCGTLSYNLTV